jgi:glycosyltransferase involved in cell wall biosynthesis
MAMAVPMVATKVGGVSDIATDNVDALLVPPRDPDSMATALGKLINDAHLRTRLGEAGALRIRNSFSLDACVSAYLRLYELMLRQPVLASADIVRQFQSETLDPAVSVSTVCTTA